MNFAGSSWYKLIDTDSQKTKREREEAEEKFKKMYGISDTVYEKMCRQSKHSKNDTP